ncbi:hypothetical protein PQX77_021050 [Marasmius sp. AFHP31]|nr:hypothetical protein PQX77_021050 [Marasmius sp. AFHP31]
MARAAQGVATKSGVKPPPAIAKKKAIVTAALAKSSAKKEPEYITLLSSDEEDIVHSFKNQVNIKHKEYKDQKLTEKEHSLPQATRDYLKKRGKSHANAHLKLQTVQLSVGPIILGPTGQKSGTRVPPETRGFQPDELMRPALEKMVNMFNEPGSHWMREFSGKPIVFDHVIWTFKETNCTNVPKEWITESIGRFFDYFSVKPGCYLKAGDIRVRKIVLAMQIPIEDTQSEVEDLDSDSEPQSPVKGKRKATSQRSRVKIKREKTEDSDNSSLRVKSEDLDSYKINFSRDSETGDVKAEPSEDRLPAPPVSNPKPKLNLLLPVEFARMTLEDGKVVEDGGHRASVAILPTRTTEKYQIFKFVEGSNVYSAFRFLDKENATRFDCDVELACYQSLLVQRDFLATSLDGFLKKLREYACQSVPEDAFVPGMFVAVIRAPDGTTKDIFLCGRKEEVGEDAMAAPTDFLEALSHYSSVSTKGERIVVDMHSCSVNGRLSIHGGRLHSKDMDGAIGDEGPFGMGFFDENHRCEGVYCHCGWLDEYVDGVNDGSEDRP